MTREQRMVQEFYHAIGHTLPGKPTMIMPALLRLHRELIQEETTELLLAMDRAMPLADIAKELADTLYVVYGAALAYGIDMEPVFQAVHESNMTKVADGHRDARGKWMKPASYRPADIEPILQWQNDCVTSI